MNPVFFATLALFRQWLEQHHDTAQELLVGFYKKASGKPSIVYGEALDEALCFGWIDGVRKSLDEDSYTIRFTPRKPGSLWSLVNIKHVGELTNQGRMQPAGLKAFEARDEQKTHESYSPEVRNRGLDTAYQTQFKENAAAWVFFQSQAPSYQKSAAFWVMSAKQEPTRQKRLAALIEDSASGRKIKELSWTAKPKS